MAFVCVILKPCSASRAAPACTSFSNSTKAMSWRPGTKRTSLNPGNLGKKPHGQFHCEQIGQDKNVVLRCYWLVEEHGEHEFVRLLRQVGEEEDMIGRVFWNLWGQKGNYSQNNREKNKLLLFLRGLEDLSDSNHTHTTCWGICPGICPGIIPPGGIAPGGIWPGAIPGGGIMFGGGM